MTASTTAGAILIALSISFAVVASAKHHGVVNRPKGHIRKRKRSGDNEAATRMAADKRRVHHDPAGEDHMVIQNEEIEFWTRLLQGSMPVPVPTTIRPQPSTPRPTNSLPPSAPVSRFNCSLHLSSLARNLLSARNDCVRPRSRLRLQLRFLRHPHNFLSISPIRTSQRPNSNPEVSQTTLLLLLSGNYLITTDF